MTEEKVEITFEWDPVSGERRRVRRVVPEVEVVTPPVGVDIDQLKVELGVENVEQVGGLRGFVKILLGGGRH